MLNNFLNKLEDPENPLLGPNIKALKFWGLLLHKQKFRRFLDIFLNVSVVFFVVTEYIDLWLNRNDSDLVLENLKSSMSSTSNALKVVTMYIWQKRWHEINDYVNRADKYQRSTSNLANKTIINKYTRYSRKITYVYWCLIFFTGMVVILQPLLKYALSSSYRYNVKNGTERYVEVVRSWVPFDKTNFNNYIAISLFQSYATIIGIGWVTSFDTHVVVILVFFRVELEVLRNDCKDIFGSSESPANEDESFQRLKDCHRRYNEFIRYTRMFNSCVSPVMLIYVLSKELMKGPYESNWWASSASRQKDVCILIHQFNKTIVFTAGPFTELTVATFLSILKGAYSYYTILSQSKNN
ncbi:unnamed protein product [Parnassius mnemosyne]|uniref:Odorant receptor n=1 Tax=Parnassius mnemosyne TaxID=213953 RepID=A0AAV1L2D5_9NEOP